jgi:predicted transcriptional regulator with HTH domain
MTPEEQNEIAAHSQAIAKILYRNTAKEELTSLGKIEVAVRDGLKEYVMPEVGIFLSEMSQKRQEDIKDTSKV